MEGKSGSMNYWRSFFRSTEEDIFEVIEQAIMLAAVVFPIEFRDRRDGIAEKLFSCRVSKFFGCNTMELMVPDACEDLRVEEGGVREKWEVIEKRSKVDGSYSYGEAEALTEMMDEESRVTGEVLRLKEVLLNSNAQQCCTNR